MTTVVVVDDEELVRDGLVAVLGAAPDLVVVGTAADGVEAVAVTVRERPDVVLMDLRLPQVDGVEATRRIVAARVPSTVLVLTTMETDEAVTAALRAGASGFLLKSSSRERLHASVRAVAVGDFVLAPTILRRLVDERLAVGGARRSPGMRLTDRQRDVARLVAAGLTNAEVAERLSLSTATVKGYVSDVLTANGLRDRTQLVVRAYESGLVRREVRSVRPAPGDTMRVCPDCPTATPRRPPASCPPTRSPASPTDGSASTCTCPSARCAAATATSTPTR